MGAEVKLYLQEHSLPQLFEGLMTGLIYNRPKQPLRFLETAIAQIRANPDEELTWDMFIDKTKFNKPPQSEGTSRSPKLDTTLSPKEIKDRKISTKDKTKVSKLKERKKRKNIPLTSSREGRSSSQKMGRAQRSPSVMKAAEVAHIPHVPIILFMGGPGGGKTRHAARVASALADQGLVHICMPDIIRAANVHKNYRNALAKYKDHYSEWKTANEHYLRGELIPNHLALALVKAEMGRYPEANAFFLEGFPREARQVQSVNMALILDYDEKTYENIWRREDWIPGEKDDQNIFERMRDLVRKAMSTGVPVLNSNPPSQPNTRAQTGSRYNGSPNVTNGVEVEKLEQKIVSTMISTEQISEHDNPCDNTSAPILAESKLKTEIVELSKADSQPNISNIVDDLSTNDNKITQLDPSSNKSDNAAISTSTPIIPIPSSAAAEESLSQKSPDSTSPNANGESTTLSLEKSEHHGLSVNAPVILVIGAPGARKHEVAERIVQKYDGFVLLSMGMLLRAKVAEEAADELWQRIVRKINLGEPVPMKLCRELLYNEIHRIGQTSWGYVIEGYPRNEAQLNDLLITLGKIDLAILIDCTEQFCLDTIAKRFHVNSTPRSDDDPEVAKTRMSLFKQNTLPMLKVLDEKGLLRVVRFNGMPYGDFRIAY
ncbi:hypothetical protein DICVIV_09599 [Dictyocaulus viviparus]|uniref:Adenylate kinase n=1 Tax=Dictyocaulus viviparus TaxID=29172 RepID=A0A0D8XKL4_DICVI|nr:hypothetical protein DICVIV_09599 [Dictyocaulus viviparus]